MDESSDELLKKGVSAHRQNRLNDASTFYSLAIRKDPQNAIANHNLGIVMLETGSANEAQDYLETALSLNSDQDEFWTSLLRCFLAINKHENARKLAVKAATSGKPELADKLNTLIKKKNPRFDSITTDPSSKEVSQRLAQYFSNQMYAECLNFIDSLPQELQQAYETINLRGASLLSLGRLKEAKTCYTLATSLYPKAPDLYNNLGAALMRGNDYGQSIDAFKNALALQPIYPDAMFNLALAFRDVGRTSDAIISLENAIEMDPHKALYLYNYGALLKNVGKVEEAIEVYKKALELKPDYFEVYYNLGNALRAVNRHEAALISYKKAISLNPNYPEAYNNLGVAHRELGAKHLAAEYFNRAIDLKPSYSEAHRHLTIVKKYTSDRDAHLKKMTKLYQNQSLSIDDKCNLAFGLAKAHEDLGEYQGSFNFYCEANKLRKEILGYTFQRDKALFNDIRSAHYKISSIDKGKNTFGKSKITPVFIVGMPRSGTTLVEQILSSHNSVYGCGELVHAKNFGADIATGIKNVDINALKTFRNNYLSTIHYSAGNSRFATDKMPTNFRFISLILTALPEAKIVHVMRSPGATCWSNFKQYYVTQELGFCYNLSDLIEYYDMYSELMSFWDQEYPNKIYHLSYEEMTLNQEKMTRDLTNYLGLPWDDILMKPEENKRSVNTASMDQVREKVYSGSSNAWKKFEPYLDGIFDKFESQKS